MREEIDQVLQTLGDLEREDAEQSSYLKGRADGTSRSRLILSEICDGKIVRPTFTSSHDSRFKSADTRLSTANGRHRPEPVTLASAIRVTLREQGAVWTKVDDLSEMLARQGFKVSRHYLWRVLRIDARDGIIEQHADRRDMFRAVPLREVKVP
jgi:hypothetical protein